jgi:hypothetical protein
MYVVKIVCSGFLGDEPIRDQMFGAFIKLNSAVDYVNRVVSVAKELHVNVDVIEYYSIRRDFING